MDCVVVPHDLLWREPKLACVRPEKCAGEELTRKPFELPTLDSLQQGDLYLGSGRYLLDPQARALSRRP